MASRLIERLDQAIIRSEDLVVRECLKAERAAALARHGFLSDARFALTGLRTQSRRLRQPVLNAWVHLLDGLIDHFGALAPEAHGKFEAARREAAAAGNRPLQAQASAWLANCDFNARRYDAMATALIEALRLATADDHATRARVELVLADASRLAGCDDALAQGHYNAVRLHAVADGDTAMISALLHNRASFRNGILGLDDAFGNSRMDDAHSTLIEASSIENFDQGLGNGALSAMQPIMRAQLCLVLQRWDEAVALFDAHMRRARVEGLERMAARYMVERAWCHAQTARWTQAQADADTAERLVPTLVDQDDLAATHARLARLFELLGQPDRVAGHWQKAHAALQVFRDQQATLAEALQRVDAALRQP
jgi:tetratricopeptide (TPR) repeat protein